MKIDMHSHTRGSDGKGTPDQIAEVALDAGLDGLCLTDHHVNVPGDNDEVYRVAEAVEAAGVKAFIGVEYSTKQGHLLIYGIDVPLEAWGLYPQMQDVIDDVNAMGGACIAAHPYQGYRYSLQHKVKDIQGLAALEGINGKCLVKGDGNNAKAMKAAAEMGLPTTGGSDAHFARHTGIAYTEFERTIEDDLDLVAALKEGRFRPFVNEHVLAAEMGYLGNRDRRRRDERRMAFLPPAPHFTLPFPDGDVSL